MKAYTDLEQSKKMAEFLPLESADMLWEQHNGNEPYVTIKPWTTIGRSVGAHVIHCWSLAALLEQLPEIINYEDDESDYTLEISKENDLYYLSYGNPFEHGKLEVEPQENFVDACVELIEKLHEQKLL